MQSILLYLPRDRLNDFGHCKHLKGFQRCIKFNIRVRFGWGKQSKKTWRKHEENQRKQSGTISGHRYPWAYGKGTPGTPWSPQILKFIRDSFHSGEKQEERKEGRKEGKKEKRKERSKEGRKEREIQLKYTTSVFVKGWYTQQEPESELTLVKLFTIQ